MKKNALFVLPVLALFAACDNAGLMSPDALESKGAAAPSQEVSGTIALPAGSSTWVSDGTYRDSGTGNPQTEGGAPRGTCGTNGLWYNTNGNPTSTYHTHCSNGSWQTTETEIVFGGFVATWVEARNGNRNLNFSVCVNDEETGESTCSTSTFLHYQANQHRTTGSGVLYGDGWQIDLADATQAGNIFSGKSASVTAVSANSSGKFTMTW
jgi:hypothetical protein